MSDQGQGGGGDDSVIAAAVAGDEGAFAVLTNRHRRELQVHCYRMLGSLTDAEDLVQETFLKAWRRRDSFRGRSSYRAWLYRIATNACLDFLALSSRRVNRLPTPAELAGSPGEIPWLQPYPDRLLDEIAPAETEPDAVVVAKETIALAFLTAIQLLPATQRAVLILRDVLEWPAKETADVLGTSVPSVNSSLQRAKATIRQHHPSGPARALAPAAPSEDERILLQRYMAAHESADAGAVIALLHEDIRLTMPPHPAIYQGLDALMVFLEDVFGPGSPGQLRLVPTRANRQPATALYVRAEGDTVFRAMCLDVLQVEGDAIVEITTFEPHLLAALVSPPRCDRLLAPSGALVVAPPAPAGLVSALDDRHRSGWRCRAGRALRCPGHCRARRRHRGDSRRGPLVRPRRHDRRQGRLGAVQRWNRTGDVMYHRPPRRPGRTWAMSAPPVSRHNQHD